MRPDGMLIFVLWQSRFNKCFVSGHDFSRAELGLFLSNA